jgi:hypothetical protein
MVTIVTRAAKGTPLTSAEMDANLQNLKVAAESIPQSAKTAACTLGLEHLGGHVSSTGGGFTIPANVFSIGNVILLHNNSATAQTITCSALTCYQAGIDPAKTSYTLAVRGLASILFHGANACTISGNIS